MEFENLQIEIPIDEDDSEKVESSLNPAWEKKYHNKSKGFVVGLDLSSKEAADKRERRAKRFGIGSTGTTSNESNDLLKIDLKNIEFPKFTDAAFADRRPEALFVHGVSNMSTKDVFDYFKDYGPDTMEWIDDHSCNVVWERESMANTALKGMSRTVDEIRQSNETAKIDTSFGHDDNEAEHIWRIGKPCKKAKCLFLRQATVEDKKLPGAAKRSLYYLIHGKGRGQKPGIVSSSRKRRMEHANTFIKENVKSNKPEVQFLSVNEKKKADESGDELMDLDDDSSIVPAKKTRELHDGGKMYSDAIDLASQDSGAFPKVKKEENLRIEISNVRGNSTKWTSTKRNQHKREGSSSDDESDDDVDDDDSDIPSDDDLATRSPLTDKDVDDLPEDNDSGKEEDLRDQINSTDLRAKIDSQTLQKKPVQDLRSKLHQKKKHLGLTKEQLNLCIEVTEISDED